MTNGGEVLERLNEPISKIPVWLMESQVMALFPEGKMSNIINTLFIRRGCLNFAHKLRKASETG